MPQCTPTQLNNLKKICVAFGISVEVFVYFRILFTWSKNKGGFLFFVRKLLKITVVRYWLFHVFNWTGDFINFPHFIHEHLLIIERSLIVIFPYMHVRYFAYLCPLSHAVICLFSLLKTILKHFNMLFSYTSYDFEV
jgi:hypothetical protein